MSDYRTILDFDELQLKVANLERKEQPASLIARYSTNAGQSIPNNTVTIIDYEDMTYDTHAAVTVGAAWHFTAPIGGYYAVTAKAVFASTNTFAQGEALELRIYKNGAYFSQIDFKDNFEGTANHYADLNGSDIVHLAKDETLDIRISQISGGAINLYNDGSTNHVCIHKITGSGQSNRLTSYTVANGSVDRIYDANSTTLDELADIVYSIIKDLGGAP